MGTRVNVQSLIEANLNTSILWANSLPPQFFIWQELSTTTFVVWILFHFINQNCFWHISLQRKCSFGPISNQTISDLGQRSSLHIHQKSRCLGWFSLMVIYVDKVKWGWVNLVQMASAHLWLEVKDMVGDSEVVLQSVKTDGKVSDNHNEDSECSSWRWWSYMMIIWLRTPEGGKEDAVSHGERQPQFLFCKIRMTKVRRRNWEWSLTG